MSAKVGRDGHVMWAPRGLATPVSGYMSRSGACVSSGVLQSVRGNRNRAGSSLGSGAAWRGRRGVGDALVVEFASDPPPLSPGAARAVLDMLLNARDKQAGNASGADDGGRQVDGPMPAVPCEVPRFEQLFCRAFT